MIVVSGCPRSGTSSMMDCLRLSFGDERILGSKFPQEDRVAMALEKHEKETDDEFETRRYIKELLSPPKNKDISVSKDMNPNGFWECPYSVKGVKWHLNMPDLNGKICKIVSQGLFHSDPQFIDKIIYMLRDPRQVAKSQERLKRLPFLSHQEEIDSGLIVHSPDMFIGVTYQACKWILANPQVPILIVNFDDLIMFPNETLENVRIFLGEGDFSNHNIDPKLKRSYPKEIANDLWEYADTIYELMKQKKYQEIVDFYEENSKIINREKIHIPCVRLRERMAYNECVGCKINADLVSNLIKRAEEKNIAWQYEPCIFDCLCDPLNDHISMKESVRNNHWIKFSKGKKE